MIDDIYRAIQPSPPTVDVPDIIPGLNAQLMPHQAHTLQWMLSRERDHNGGALCEAVGLGKTMEVIAMVLSNPPQADYYGTLIICPSVIVRQWQSELSTFAPSLSVHVLSKQDTHQSLQGKQIVIASYDFAQKQYNLLQSDSQRSRRYHRVYERPRSVLDGDCVWWRLVCDEAQMIESSYSQASKVCGFIQRRYSWAVTGTPFSGVESKLQSELYGILNFIGEPFVDLNYLSKCMRRNTKEGCQLKFPKQHVIQHAVYFSDVERAFYDGLLSEIERSLDLEDAQDLEDISRIKSWVLRLRQTCVHYQIGQHNRRVFGNQYRSVSEALKIMYESSRSEYYSLQRQLLATQISTGMHVELLKEFDQSIKVYLDVLIKVDPVLERLQLDYDNLKATRSMEEEDDLQDDDIDTIQKSDDFFSMAQGRLKSWLSLKHQALFCLASVHLYLSEHGQPDQKSESDQLFEKAEQVRNKLMSSYEISVHRNIDQLRDYQARHAMECQLEEPEFEGGLLSRQVFDNIRQLTVWLNDQMLAIKQYRTKLMEAAFRDLHDNYADDAAMQELGHLYQDYYLDSLQRRRYMLVGVPAVVKQFNMSNNQRRGLMQDDLELPADQMEVFDLNLKSEMQQLKGITMRVDTNKNEIAMCQAEYDRLARQYKVQMKTLMALEQELPLLTKLWNKRVMFYRVLQKLSDHVALPEVAVETVPGLIQKFEATVQSLQVQSDSMDKKLRYMENLKVNQDEDCHICREKLSTQPVMITPCAHTFHRVCLSTWFKLRQVCPSCNTRVQLSTITIVDNSEIRQIAQQHQQASKYFPLPSQLPKLQGGYSSKVALISKHILWLTSSDPTIKCLLFSQWEDVLKLIYQALQQNNIQAIRLDASLSKAQRDEAASNFMNDPSIRVLMLNAKSQSAGLTLINATHVFIVEPNLNTSIEEQAVARVHRVGQTLETYVHRYTVINSIEEEIIKIAQPSAQVAQQEVEILRSELLKFMQPAVQEEQERLLRLAAAEERIQAQ